MNDMKPAIVILMAIVSHIHALYALFARNSLKNPSIQPSPVG